MEADKKHVLSIDLETYSDVDLGNCGVYRYVEDEGRCTALNAKADPSACGFFKTTELALSECRRCYRRLKEQERSNLITRYIKALTALSMLDEEIDAEEHNREQLDAFEKTNYQEQLESMIASENTQDTDQP